MSFIFVLFPFLDRASVHTDPRAAVREGRKDGGKEADTKPQLRIAVAFTDGAICKSTIDVTDYMSVLCVAVEIAVVDAVQEAKAVELDWCVESPESICGEETTRR